MQLDDDDLFKLWRDEKMYTEDVLAKAKDADRLALRIINYKRGLRGIVPDELGDDDQGYGGGS